MSLGVFQSLQEAQLSGSAGVQREIHACQHVLNDSNKTSHVLEACDVVIDQSILQQCDAELEQNKCTKCNTLCKWRGLTPHTFN